MKLASGRDGTRRLRGDRVVKGAQVTSLSLLPLTPLTPGTGKTGVTLKKPNRTIILRGPNAI
ncbi:hypothetical protein E2C01_011667 [Portunus trituberculatus]|uniref:Uncharacterized protein n=1 Tax=Portunus trituberculatus TaxID=210409 RepID=A0A5B7DBN4_PORTR|nr:hypothetical protein [Portunus trituberculatus]